MTDPLNPETEYQVPYEDELKDKRFNKILDSFLQIEKTTLADYESLTPMQREVIQTLKRAFARIKSHYEST